MSALGKGASSCPSREPLEAGGRAEERGAFLPPLQRLNKGRQAGRQAGAAGGFVSGVVKNRIADVTQPRLEGQRSPPRSPHSAVLEGGEDGREDTAHIPSMSFSCFSPGN